MVLASPIAAAVIPNIHLYNNLTAHTHNCAFARRSAARCCTQFTCHTPNPSVERHSSNSSLTPRQWQ